MSRNVSEWNAEDPAAESEPTRRKELYFEAEKIVCPNEAIIAPLFHSTFVRVAKPYPGRTYNPLWDDIATWKVKAH